MNIPTARELIKKHKGYRSVCMEELYDRVSPQTMIEFTKFHVEAALKEASKRAQVKVIGAVYVGEVVENSILNAYPLTNIK